MATVLIFVALALKSLVGKNLSLVFPNIYFSIDLAKREAEQLFELRVNWSAQDSNLDPRIRS